MKTFFGIICATICAIAITSAQNSDSQVSQSQGRKETTTTVATTESTGVITEFTPGSTIVLNTGSGEPVHYKLGKTVAYANAKGKEITALKIKKDRKVRVHYVKEGNDMVVDKITIVRD